MPHRDDGPERFPQDAILIIGAGHFGSRASRILSSHSPAPIWIVDKDIDRLTNLRGPRIEKILCEGIDFLVTHFHRLAPSTTIVPAIPRHLAFEWLKRFLKNDFQVRQVAFPDGIEQHVPHTWRGQEGSQLISYADFRCPDDCPEPADYCTVTGKRRGLPLYELLTRLDVSGHRVHILRSHQLAPGVGGYPVADLMRLMDQVTRKGQGTWLAGTACRCHGIVTAMQIHRTSPRESRTGTRASS